MLDELPKRAAWRHEITRHGFETVFISSTTRGWRFAGHTTAVEDDRAWTVRYQIAVDRHWRTRTARVWSWSDAGASHALLASDGSGRWKVNGNNAPHLTGCLDVDLESSACTNTFPVHRLQPEVGISHDAPAAYVRAAGGKVERLEQTYSLRAGGDGRSYDYAAPAFDFRCRLDYDASGLVVHYPGIATRVL